MRRSRKFDQSGAEKPLEFPPVDHTREYSAPLHSTIPMPEQEGRFLGKIYAKNEQAMLRQFTQNTGSSFVEQMIFQSIRRDARDYCSFVSATPPAVNGCEGNRWSEASQMTGLSCWIVFLIRLDNRGNQRMTHDILGCEIVEPDLRDRL